MDRVALRQDLALDDDAAALLRAEVGARQEDHADGELSRARLIAAARDVLAEEILRDLDMDAGAVAGLAIGIDGAAVPDGLQRRNRRLNHLAARLAIEGRDDANAAGVMLLARIVEAPGREMGGIAPV